MFAHQVGDHTIEVFVSNEHGTGSGDMVLRVTGPPEYAATTKEPESTTTSTSTPVSYSNYDDEDIIEEHTQPGLIAIIKSKKIFTIYIIYDTS